MLSCIVPTLLDILSVIFLASTGFSLDPFSSFNFKFAYSSMYGAKK